MLTTDLHVIMGLGLTGQSVAAYLEKQDIPWLAMDSRLNPPNLAEFKQAYPHRLTILGEWDQAYLNQAARIVLSPGISLQTPIIAKQRQRGTPIIGDIELFAQGAHASNTPVIAITGTNAKSTVTTLVGEIAKYLGEKVQIGGNLGVPALNLLQENETNLFVLELSSFQLETTETLCPHVASILNITPDHMDRYASLHAYQQAKQRIYHQCRVAICNRDDNLTDHQSGLIENKLYFTLNQPNAREFGLLYHQNEYYLTYEDQLLIAVNELPLLGKHHYANALAALAIGYGFGWSIQAMLPVLRSFKGLPHRCQFVREYVGVKWYNDSKGTNVGASCAAIEGLGSTLTGKLVLIAGGVGKQADFRPLMHFAKQYVRHLVLIGEAAEEMAALCQAESLSFSLANTMEKAVHQAKHAAIAGDSVLLSPACASFDMFQNFEHRGRVFMEIVENL